MTTHHDHDDNLTRGLDHTGAPRLAAAIRSVRAGQPTTVVDDDGDLWARGRDGNYWPVILSNIEFRNPVFSATLAKLRGTYPNLVEHPAPSDRTRPDGLPASATRCVADRCSWDTRGTGHGAGTAACVGAPIDPAQPCLIRSAMAAGDDGESYRRHHPDSYAADPKPWAEGTWPTAAQLDDWIHAHPAGDPHVRMSLAALLAAADRGTRCLDADHAADLALLDRIADDLVAARDRVRRLEHTHPADLPGSLDADQAGE